MLAEFSVTEHNTVSVSVQDGIVALGKAHTRSAGSLSSLHKVALETVPMFGCTKIVLDLEGGMSKSISADICKCVLL